MNETIETKSKTLKINDETRVTLIFTLFFLLKTFLCSDQHDQRILKVSFRQCNIWQVNIPFNIFTKTSQLCSNYFYELFYSCGISNICYFMYQGKPCVPGITLTLGNLKLVNSILHFTETINM